MISAKTIGENIRYYRKALGMTAFALSIQLNITYKYLSYIETGKKIPSVELLITMANFFNIPLSEIVYRQNDNFVFRDELLRIGSKINIIQKDYPDEMDFLYSTALVVSNM